MSSTEKDDLVYLEHIRDAACRALLYVHGRDRAAFDNDPLLQDGVVRRLEIIGEAAGQVSKSFRAAHPEVPWAAMIGMRNRIVHDYLNVDLDIVWNTVHHDLPNLLQVLQRITRRRPDLSR